MDALVQLRGIKKSYGGVKALRGVDFDIRPGEIHALLGENGAGKSTLMKVLGGDISANEGTIIVDGKTANYRGPADAKASGIQMIHQELALAPDLSVAENIYLGALPTVIKWRDLNRAAGEVLDRFGFDIGPREIVGKLPIALQQIVEIAKALSKKARIIVFDEPTAVLSGKDAERLHEIMLQLRAQGVGVVYISHRLDEVFEVADRMTVLKDGETVGTIDAKDTDVAQIISMMVGRRMSAMFPEKPETEIGHEVLRVENLGRGRKVLGVNFSVRAGEIVGLGGLVGSGRTEVAKMIFGADPIETGKVYLNGEELRLKSPHDAVRAGINLLPEDRKGEGVVIDFPIKVNSTMAMMGKITNKFGFIRHSTESRDITELTDQLTLKCGHIGDPVSTLSGGNQQKVVLAKWMFAGGELIIFDEPTRGVDVGAKSEIYGLINQMAADGKAVLVISSEHQELFGICDRILVMGNGALQGELLPPDFSDENLLHLAMASGVAEQNGANDV
ncbi:sugar ABC transporter ATP-binding protein [Boseongicola aestuarii]|uniref:Ribose import ATP-binding protein RbsA n=1 Tax=Boseongicola aestuarii TaxID=1470561 RepID=A0A238IZD6_9RHOB|nr:sugar ABC transporter ATP-binding protein [Boseongicola aestuarii]SMX23352.1 Ribose import ATP-binding protein RbsA [Boseongicola aestuarii]